jgi:hypothetical protein
MSSSLGENGFAVAGLCAGPHGASFFPAYALFACRQKLPDTTQPSKLALGCEMNSTSRKIASR